MEDENEVRGMGYSGLGAQTESQAGCTATVVLLTPSEIYCANAGDSSIRLIAG